MSFRGVFIFVPVLAVLSGCARSSAPSKPDVLMNAYDSEVDWNDPQRIIPLNYEQGQGKRIFYVQCIWCHADATPAGPSNRSNLTPTPALMSDGAALNGMSDESLRDIIARGGSAMEKSAMMPPFDRTLTSDQIRAVTAYIRAIAVPPYQPSGREGLARPAR